jgi:small subunit ribosomal protein S13
MVENIKPTQSSPKDFKHIVRVANVDIPGEKILSVSLTKIKGVGKSFAHAICVAATIDKSTKTGNLTNDEVKKLNSVVTTFDSIPKWMYNRTKDYDTGEDKHILTGDLIFSKDNDIKRLKRIKSYTGLRHQKGLTVRGQRTRSNFRRHKGKVVGVKKKGPQGKK